MLNAKIVQLSKFYPPELGGIETVARDLSVGFARRGYLSKVLAFTRRSSGSEVLEGVEVERVLTRLFLNTQPLSLRWIIRAAAMAADADVVIMQWPNLLPIVLIPLWWRKKLIIFWQADIIDKGLLGRLVAPLQAALLRSATMIWTSTPAYHSVYLEPVKHKVSALPIGIPDPSGLFPDAILPEEIRFFLGDRKLVFAVGRLVPYKGFDQIIRAAARLSADAAIVIVGSGPESDVLQRLVDAEGVGDRVMLAGRQSDAALHALFRRSHVYAMSSNGRGEGFGIVQVEAMAHGIPVVATQVPGSGVAWVSDMGAIGGMVPINDPRAMADALNQVLADPHIEKLRRRSRARYEQEFTDERMIDRAIEMMRPLLVSK